MPLRIRFTTTCCTWMRSATTSGRPSERSKRVRILAVGGADQRQSRRVADDVVDDDRLALAGAARDEAAQAADHFAGAMGLGDRLLHVLGRAACLVRAGLDQAAGGLAEVGDRGEGLVEFVDDHRGDLAHGRQAPDVAEFLLQGGGAGLGRHPFGDVADEAGERVAVAAADLADGELDGKGAAVAVAGDDGAADADDALLAGGEVAREVAVVLGMVGLGHQQIDVSAEHLFGGVAEHALGGGAEAVDDARGVDGNDGVGRRIDHRAQHGGIEPARVAGVGAGLGDGGAEDRPRGIAEGVQANVRGEGLAVAAAQAGLESGACGETAGDAADQPRPDGRRDLRGEVEKAHACDVRRAVAEGGTGGGTGHADAQIAGIEEQKAVGFRLFARFIGWDGHRAPAIASARFVSMQRAGERPRRRLRCRARARGRRRRGRQDRRRRP